MATVTYGLQKMKSRNPGTNRTRCGPDAVRGPPDCCGIARARGVLTLAAAHGTCGRRVRRRGRDYRPVTAERAMPASMRRKTSSCSGQIAYQ